MENKLKQIIIYAFIFLPTLTLAEGRLFGEGWLKCDKFLEDVETNFASVQSDVVSDRTIFPDDSGETSSFMDHHKILDIGPSANPDFMYFAAGNGIGPDAGAFPNVDFSLDLSSFVNERGFIQYDVWTDMGHGMARYL